MHITESQCSVVPLHSTLYPEALHSFSKRPEVFYSKGDLDLLTTPSISIVGTRKPTENGKHVASDLARDLVHKKITIISGLAEGVDISAQMSAVKNHGRTIAVIGTPIDQWYPKKHQAFQEYIAQNHLLISQVPFLQYESEGFQSHRNHFPERNILMAALSDATIIIEVGNTSGTKTQALACLQNKKPLFLHRNLLDVKPDLKWVDSLLKKGARVFDGDLIELSEVVSAQYHKRLSQYQQVGEQEYLSFD